MQSKCNSMVYQDWYVDILLDERLIGLFFSWPLNPAALQCCNFVWNDNICSELSGKVQVYLRCNPECLPPDSGCGHSVNVMDSINSKLLELKLLETFNLDREDPELWRNRFLWINDNVYRYADKDSLCSVIMYNLYHWFQSISRVNNWLNLLLSV